ncbi:MAG: hypothetical protein JWM65_3716 [Sphingomonas bacterium]|nr:hypothetical protein [Sphingomonas bacterium]
MSTPSAKFAKAASRVSRSIFATVLPELLKHKLIEEAKVGVGVDAAALVATGAVSLR